MLTPWTQPLPDAFTIYIVNLYGDVFVTFEDGSIHMPDVGIGTLDRVAENRDELADLMQN